jgi:medium-chain acyl-[acyl-carrier-protein] hydrolase
MAKFSSFSSPQFDSPWLLLPRPNPAATLRLFCFPFAGGGALAYQKWPQRLPAHVEVCAVQLPGRETRLRETPFTRVEPLVAELLEAVPTDKPFALFGHSMGAIVAFEFARALRQAGGAQALHLFASGRSAPASPINRDPPFYRLSHDAFVDCLRALGGTPDAVLNHPELLEMLIPIMRADFEINESYCYTPAAPLDYPISCFRGTQDHLFSYEDAAAWAKETQATFHLHSLPGKHFFIQTDLFFQVLAHDLSAYV